MLDQSLKEFRCIYIKQDKFKEIVQSVERGSRVDTDFKNIIIRSANPEVSEYNFYKSVCGIDTQVGWFGYAVLGHSNFGQFCGATNMLNLGTAITELEIDESIQNENVAAGHGDVVNCYQPSYLIEVYSTNFPDPATLPPALLKIPFVARNGPDDKLIDNHHPEWLDHYKGPPSYVIDEMRDVTPSAPTDPDATPSTSHDGDDSPDGSLLSPTRHIRGSEDDTQSSDLGGSPPKGGTPGSTPLGDATLSQNSESGPSPGHLVKRRRATGSRFVVTEADDEDGDDEQVRARSHALTHALVKGPPPPFYFPLGFCAGGRGEAHRCGQRLHRRLRGAGRYG